MPIDSKLLEILACPICTGSIKYNKDKEELVCLADKLAFPVKENIPVMLESEARKMDLEEVEALRK